MLRKCTLAVFLILTFFTLNNCKKKDSDPEAKDLSVFNVTKESEWDYWIVSKNGDYLMTKLNSGIPKTIFYKPYDGSNGSTLQLNEKGLPEKMFIEKYIFLFENFTQNTVDIAIISPDGSIKITREIRVDMPWGALNTFAVKGRVAVLDWKDALSWTGHIFGLASCAAGIAASVGTVGLAIPLAYASCTLTIVGLIAEFLPEEYGELVGAGANMAGAYYNIFGCVKPPFLTCWLSNIASAASSASSVVDDQIDKNEENIRASEAALKNGYGDVQVTLTWNNNADLDLYVIDPFQNLINWENPKSNSGGELDIDNITAYGPENIFWPKLQAPQGTYSVFVHHYPWDDETDRPIRSNYTILVNAFGRIQKFTGSIGVDEYINISNFNQNEIRALRLKSENVKLKRKKVKK